MLYSLQKILLTHTVGPYMTLSVDFNISVSFHAATLVTGLLAFTPAGLVPAVQTSLRWTHQLIEHSRGSSFIEGDGRIKENLAVK